MCPSTTPRPRPRSTRSTSITTWTPTPGGDNSDTSDSGEASDDDSDLDTGINGDVATGDMYPEDDLNEDGGAGYGRGTALTPLIEGLGAFSASSLVKPALAIGLGIILWKTVGKKLFKRKRA